MAKFYLDADCDRSLLEGKTVAVVGYGSQGRAQTLNLRDSGQTVRVGLREGSASRAKARSESVDVATIEEAVRDADVVSLLIPDEVHGPSFKERIAPHMKEGAALCLAHGLSVHFGLFEPTKNIDVIMVAPLGAGNLLRRLYQENKGLPSYVAVHQDRSGEALKIALAYASLAGCARPGMIETTFKEETEVDLFGEQAVLCGGLSFLLLRAFDTLVHAGYQPEVAYLECINQLKASADLMSLVGLEGLPDSISSPALYGMLTRGKRVIGEEAKQAMGELLREIQSGQFVREWMREGTRDNPGILKLIEGWKSLKMHEVGRNLRKFTRL
ncbi:MAG: ketol-acid reductoisomerase [Candidatus Eisenbacteria bacterium]|nr:ketol-acid reductoisomerase [Candidatus Eisenbacteria bacterium]